MYRFKWTLEAINVSDYYTNELFGYFYFVNNEMVYGFSITVVS